MARPDDGLLDILTVTARQCDARAFLAHWHVPNGLTVLLNLVADEPCAADLLTAGRDEAISAARVAQARLGMGRQHTIAGDKCATAVLGLNGGIVTLTGISNYSGSNVDQIHDALERLLPILASYFKQWRATQTILARLRSFTETVECSGMATLLLSSDAQIIFANSAAECLLSEGDGLRRCGKRLACAKNADTIRLQAATSHVGAIGNEASGFDPVLAVSRVKRRSLTIALTNTGSPNELISDQIQAVAYVFDPEQDMTQIVEPICRLHGLSPSETRLTCALVGGVPFGSAAKAIGVQEQTARSYLKQVFAKTKTNRQSELIQLILNSAVRLSCRRAVHAVF